VPCVLSQHYIKLQLDAVGLTDSLKVGIVQTAYANGASTAYISDTVGEAGEAGEAGEVGGWGDHRTRRRPPRPPRPHSQAAAQLTATMAGPARRALHAHALPAPATARRSAHARVS
jgi:hypothetical protein